MISKQNRFHHRREVQRAYKKSQTSRAPHMSLKVAKTNKDDWRAAVVVSRKVSKLAVRRNRIRRRVFEILRKNSERVPTSHDYIFTVFDDSLIAMSHDDLQKLVLGLLEKAREKS